MPRPATLDHLRSGKKPVTKTVTIAMDSQVADEYAAAKEEFDIARQRVAVRPNDSAVVDEFNAAEDRYMAARDAMDDNAVTFTFRAIGRERFEAIVLEHPPTKDQKEQARKAGEHRLGWNLDTFPIALIAESSHEPKLAKHEVEELWKSEDWNQAELMTLFFAALEVNQNRRVVDLGKD